MIFSTLGLLTPPVPSSSGVVSVGSKLGTNVVSVPVLRLHSLCLRKDNCCDVNALLTVSESISSL